MTFYTACNEPRPVRLSERTRRFAWESMQGKYGTEAVATPHIEIPDMEAFDKLSDYEQYDEALRHIAGEAPLRLCEGESVCGAATLGDAIGHVVPYYSRERGIHPIVSVSHVTLGFDRAVREGVDVLAGEAQARLRDPALEPRQRAFLTSVCRGVESLHIWHERYRQATKDSRPDLYALLEQVPFGPAQTFHEAVQSLWFLFAFTRLCGNWPGIGRIDQLLGGYLERDLERGALTLDEAREILAGFFIKGCEWIQKDTPVGSGDAQHYQNIVLAGIDEEGREVTNEVTYLVLDIVEELGISDFPISVRLHEKSPDKLLVRMAQVIRHGGGVVAAYAEPVVLDCFRREGYSLEEARRFANDGCWEVQVPGKTHFFYIPFDALQVLLHDTLHLQDTPAVFASFEELYAAFSERLRDKVEAICGQVKADRLVQGPEAGQWSWRPQTPCPVVSLLTEGCVATGRSYFEGGPVYTVASPHIGGAPDVVNSLYAIKKLVFDDKLVDFARLMAILQNNWEGEEALRQYASSQYVYYGNDNDEVDAVAVRLLDDFAAMVRACNDGCPIRFTAGVSTFGRQIEWAPFRAAVPFGRRKGDILAPNLSPTPGTDTEGATAVIRSYCKADLRNMGSGAALDVELYPTTAQGEAGIAALVGLLRGFVRLGGFFLQMDVIDRQALLEAQKHPEQYKTLSVRVSGWNARFVTLNREWQTMIIEKAARGE